MYTPRSWRRTIRARTNNGSRHRVRPLHGGNGKIPGGPLKKFRMSRKRQAKVLRMNGETRY